MDKFVLCLTGKKQSGKDSAADYIASKVQGVELFSFATPIKEFSVSMLGLKPEWVYGTDEQKNTLTKYRWQDLPRKYWVVPKGDYRKITDDEFGTFDKTKHRLTLSPSQHEQLIGWQRKGFMTAREVVQYWATEIIRYVDPEMHVKRCAERIEESNCTLAVIKDLRFLNELYYARYKHWKTLRFLRAIDNDGHISETELDGLHPENFSGTIDNANLSVNEKNSLIYDYLIEWGLV